MLTLDDGRTATLLTTALLTALSGALDTLASAASRPRWILLRGNGRGSFAAGADLAEIASLDPLRARRLSRAGQETFERLARAAPWPTAALVDGHAFGGGFDLALACDLVFATPDARFCHPGASRGLFTGWGGTARLPRLARGSAAGTALLTGGELGAIDAAKAGFAWPAAKGETGVAEARRRLDVLAGWPRATLDAWRAERRRAPWPLSSALARLAAAETGAGPRDCD